MLWSTKAWCFWVVTLMSVCNVGWAEISNDDRKPTPAELGLLPNYCKHTSLIGNPNRYPMDPTSAYWVSQMGDDFWHMHHYCWALNFVNRSTLARSAKERSNWLNMALHDFEYVRKATTPNFKLRPEAYTQEGKALVALGKLTQAAELFRMAIAFEPSYWPPYAHLADLYVQQRDFAAAKATLDEGLTNSANQPALLRRKTELDAMKKKK